MPVMWDLPFSARGLKLKNGTCHPPLSSVSGIFDGDVGVRVIDQGEDTGGTFSTWKQAISFGDEGPPKKLFLRR